MRGCLFVFLLILAHVVCSAQCSLLMPTFLTAVLGSCAEIRCTFDNDDNYTIPNGKWLKLDPGPGNRSFSVVYDSNYPHRKPYNYGWRTEFKGNISKKQCSLLIKDIRKSDEGTYKFILEFPLGISTNEHHTVGAQISLSVKEKPEISGYGELIAGQTQRLTCSIIHNCPDGNLQLKWIHYNVFLPLPWNTQNQSGFINERLGSRRVSSVLTFTPSSAHHGAILGCTIIMDGIPNPSPQTLTLKIKYRATIVEGPTCTSAKNWIICTCRIRANPPGNITWDLNGRILTGNRSSVEVFSREVKSHLVESSLRLTHPTGAGKLISCVAANELGDSVSKYQLRSEEIISRTIVLIIGGGATGLVILIAIMFTLKIQRKKRSETVCVLETASGSLVYTEVQKALKTERDGQCAGAVRCAPQPDKPAQNEEIVYATVNATKIRNHEPYSPKEETCVYAPIKHKCK